MRIGDYTPVRVHAYSLPAPRDSPRYCDSEKFSVAQSSPATIYCWRKPGFASYLSNYLRHEDPDGLSFTRRSTPRLKEVSAAASNQVSEITRLYFFTSCKQNLASKTFIFMRSRKLSVRARGERRNGLAVGLQITDYRLRRHRGGFFFVLVSPPE